jgi:hypothetical protein
MCDHFVVPREHAFLMPEGARLPFRTLAPIFTSSGPKLDPTRAAGRKSAEPERYTEAAAQERLASCEASRGCSWSSRGRLTASY